MDLSPTDLQLVSYDLYKTDEKYDFQLTDILRRRNRPILFIMDTFGEVILSCRPEKAPPDDRFAAAVTPELIEKAQAEAKILMRGDGRPENSVARQVLINKPGEKCALVVLEKQFWSLRIFELESLSVDSDNRFAVLVEPIGDPKATGIDLKKVKGLFRLSNRESDVVEQLVSGGTDKEIANQLGISVETVRAYLKSIRAKLGVSTRTAIVSVVHSLRDQDGPAPD